MRSPIPKRGLIILITMVMKKHRASPVVFNRIEEFILDWSTTQSSKYKKIKNAK